MLQGARPAPPLLNGEDLVDIPVTPLDGDGPGLLRGPSPCLSHPPHHGRIHPPPAALPIEGVIRCLTASNGAPGIQDKEPEVRILGHGLVGDLQLEGLQLFHGTGLPPIFHRIGQRVNDMPARLGVPPLPMEKNPVTQIQDQRPGGQQERPIQPHESLFHGKPYELQAPSPPRYWNHGPILTCFSRKSKRFQQKSTGTAISPSHAGPVQDNHLMPRSPSIGFR